MSRLKVSIFVSLVLLAATSLASTDALDENFLIWLGETAEIEELGVDIDKLIANQGQSKPNLEKEEVPK